MNRRGDIALWALAAASLVWAAAVLVGSIAGQSLFVSTVFFYGAVLFGLAGAGLLISAVARVRRDGLPLRWTAAIPLILQLCIVAMVVASIVLDLPARGAFTLSRGDLESAARRVRSGEAVSVPARVGLFDVSRIDRSGDAVRFVVGEVGMGDHVGFVYSPRGRPAAVGEDVYDPLGGPWWSWFESW